MRRSLHRWLREPLVQFLLIGAGLFAAEVLVGDPATEEDYRIVIRMADVDRLATLWARQWNRPSTPEELRGLLEGHIKEEVLYREALAMGLDRDDTVVRRRLAQKMEFLSTDLAAQATLTDAELEAWYAERAEQYRLPATVSLTHVYISPDARGDEAEADAKSVLAALRADPDRPRPWDLGDRFMLPHEYVARPTDEIDWRFGGELAAALERFEPGVWEGPVASGFGLHLVRIDERTDAETPQFEKVRFLVERDFASERRNAVNDAFYRQLRSRYEVAFDEEIRELAAGAPGGESEP